MKFLAVAGHGKSRMAATGIMPHQKLEIAALVGAGDLLGKELGIAALGRPWQRRRGRGALLQLGLVDQNSNAALLDRKPDAIAVTHETERPAGSGVRSDVQHDGTERSAAHAR